MSNHQTDFLPRWEQVFLHRLDWAYEARERFVSDFDPSFRQFTQSGRGKGDAFVALYGNTQVGKTTLILKLLGIRTDEDGRYFREIEDVLRAGRKEGVSSTSTAIIYLRSDDDQFHLIRSNGERLDNLDADSLKTALHDIRQTVERRPGELAQHAPADEQMPFNLFVKIPGRYFEDDASLAAVNIIDLPGLGGDRKEKEHLDYILDRNLPLSTIVVFVLQLSEKGRTLNDAQHEHIRRWRHMPEAFRVVTTYTISNLKREQDGSTLAGIQTKEQLCEHVQSEYERTLKCRLPRVYPLEYGKSWEDSVRPDPGLARFQPMMDELLRDLRADLQSHATPYHKIMFAASAYNAIKAEIEKEIEDREQQTEKLREQIDTMQTLEKMLQGAIDNHRHKIKKLKEEYSEYPVSVNLKYTPDSFSQCSVKWEYEAQIDEEINKIEAAAKKYGVVWKKIALIISDCKSDLEAIFDGWLRKLIGYTFSQQSRRDKVRAILSSASSQIEQVIRERLTAIQQEGNEEIDEKIKKEKKAIRKKEEQIEQNRASMQELRKKIKSAEKALLHYQEQSRHQMEHANSFRRYLAEGFERQSAVLQSRLQAPDNDPETVLLSLFEHSLLMEEYEKLTHIQTAQ
ncbi:MAG: hypothetical protein IT259_17545 [Saprospiraceae bacterium]|nr:hypothetical protein [Saprospiraceae bacterium]